MLLRPRTLLCALVVLCLIALGESIGTAVLGRGFVPGVMIGTNVGGWSIYFCRFWIWPELEESR